MTSSVGSGNVDFVKSSSTDEDFGVARTWLVSVHVVGQLRWVPGTNFLRSQVGEGCFLSVYLGRRSPPTR